jgi:hypothetical protein
MPNQTIRITHKSTFVVREAPAGTVVDGAALKRQIAEILEGLPEAGILAPRVEKSLTAFLHSVQAQSEVARTAIQVCNLLRLELDDLRKAALLSMMVRLTGRRKFDPIAMYILQNQKVLVTGPEPS